MSMNNKIQSFPIQMNLQIKNEPKNNTKSRTTITKKNNQARKKTLKDLKSNKPLDHIYPQPKERIKTNSQIPTQIEPRNSGPINVYARNNSTNSNIKLNNSWLNKYFIYRHESLNNYLFKEEFRNTLDKSVTNYQKQIQYFLGNKNTAPQNININKNITKSYNISINSNLIKDEKNNPRKKTFIVTGGYADVVKNLTQRGWVREQNAKSLDFDYIWTLKTNEINFIQLKNWQMANHYFRNGQITRKSGLSKNIKNLYFLGADPMNFFPRCYDLSVKNELQDFKQDFKFTWTISLLIMFQKEANEQGNNSGKSRRFTSQVISTAINIIDRHLFLLEENGVLKDINNLKNSKKIYLISEQEWNIIYLPELTQNSDVQDIIYEVNSNKPGGINNPIKGKSNTVQKKLIKKTNETKNMLINTQKPGAIDTNKFSPNLQSYAGLKAKYLQMNLEEKKNNFNINNNVNSNSNTIIRKKLNLQNNNNNALSQKNNIIIKNINTVKRSTIVRNGASFNDFLPKVNSLLDSLKCFLPQYKLNGFRNIWILKPSNLSRGRGVTCVNSLEPIEQSLNATNDTGVVVQKYIENPLIINKRKFDIRQWVLVTSLNPLIIWMWKEPYLRFGAEDYIMDDLNNIYSHLTNNSIAKHSLQYKNEKKFKEDMWTCFDFENYIGKQKWKEIHEKIKNAIICSFYAIHQEIKARVYSHELYGYDFMIDEDYNVYLIEVNASPALDYSTKITEMLVKSMVADLIELVVDNDNARNCSFRVGNKSENNKFVQIFNEMKDKIDFPKNIPNKNLFY